MKSTIGLAVLTYDALSDVGGRGRGDHDCGHDGGISGGRVGLQNALNGPLHGIVDDLSDIVKHGLRHAWEGRTQNLIHNGTDGIDVALGEADDSGNIGLSLRGIGSLGRVGLLSSNGSPESRFQTVVDICFLNLFSIQAASIESSSGHIDIPWAVRE